MSDENIVTEQVEEKEQPIEEVGDDKPEDEEIVDQESEEESDSQDEADEQEEQPDVAAQMLAELQKVKDELAQIKSSKTSEKTEESAPSSFLEMNVASKVIEDKIKAGNITSEHAPFYRQLGGLIDQINATNTERTDKAIASFGGAFKQVITRLRDIDYRGFKRTYGEIDRSKLDAIIQESGNPFMTYDEAVQRSVLSDPKTLRTFLASQRGTTDKKKAPAPPVKQTSSASGTAKFREYLIRGTNELDMKKINALPFAKKAEVMNAWGEWDDKRKK